MKLTNLQGINPKNHVLVTSCIAVAGKQKTSTNKSAAARFMINIFVTVLDKAKEKNGREKNFSVFFFAGKSNIQIGIADLLFSVSLFYLMARLR